MQLDSCSCCNRKEQQASTTCRNCNISAASSKSCTIAPFTKTLPTSQVYAAYQQATIISHYIVPSYVTDLFYHQLHHTIQSSHLQWSQKKKLWYFSLQKMALFFRAIHKTSTHICFVHIMLNYINSQSKLSCTLVLYVTQCKVYIYKQRRCHQKPRCDVGWKAKLQRTYTL